MKTHEALLTPEMDAWFKQESLNLLAQQLSDSTYPDYPKQEERLICNDPREARRQLTLPGPHWAGQPLTNEAALHPWFDDMVTNPHIGVVAGKGFYWNIAANETADPIWTRHDLDETHVLMVIRGDTGKLALPGGFRDGNENPYVTSIREAAEETGYNILNFTYKKRKVYEGVLADLRVTAHAWPLTHAYHVALDAESTKDMPVGPFPGNDDAVEVHWVPVSELMQRTDVHGSHRLLILLALWKQSAIDGLDHPSIKHELDLCRRLGHEGLKQLTNLQN